MIEVRKNAFDFDSTDGRSLNWTAIQFWTVMKQLAAGESANFDELKIHPIFKSDESAFMALEQAELITIVHKHGRPYGVRPGKPIYRAAFQQILRDIGFAAVMELEAATHLEKEEMIKVAKWEAELKELANMPYRQSGSWWPYSSGGGLPKEVDARVQWLMKKLAESHAKVEKYESDIAGAKKAIAGLGLAA